jgi:hypothetical protein
MVSQPCNQGVLFVVEGVTTAGSVLGSVGEGAQHDGRSVRRGPVRSLPGRGLTVSPRTFELVRYRDLSGISGTGVVAEGCVFTDGSVALRWRGNNPATAVWPDLESILAVHGHHGATEVRWVDPVPVTPGTEVNHPVGDRRTGRAETTRVNGQRNSAVSGRTAS